MKNLLVILIILLSTQYCFGQFGDKIPLANQSYPLKSVVVYDFDNDGDNDMIFGTTNGNRIVWSPNEGSEQFKDIYVLGDENNFGLTKMDGADMDNDVDLDIIYVSWYSGHVYLYENLGNLQLAPPVTLENFYGLQDLELQDFTGNGFVDILVADESGHDLFLLENQGGLTFNTVFGTVLSYPIDVESADIDGDGDLDPLAISSGTNDVVWYENLGGGSFSSLNMINSNAQGPMRVFAEDLDGDGDQDVAFTSYAGDKVVWHENLGGGSFGPEQTVSSFLDEARGLTGADFDGDGDIDLASSSESSEIVVYHENLGGGNFAAQVVLLSGLGGNVYEEMYAEDLDLDGDMDIVSTLQHTHGNYWFENDGSGNFTEHKAIHSTEAVWARGTATGDLNNDGYTDIFSISNADDKVAYYLNDGQGNFGYQEDIDTNFTDGYAIKAGDLNEDGLIDVAVRGDSSMGWYANLGSGQFGAINVLSNEYVDGLESYGREDIEIGDADGDGDMDIVEYGWLNSGEVRFYENIGGGVFNPPQILGGPYTNNVNPFSLTFIDYDDDGDDDIFYSATHIYYIINQGGSFSAPQVLADSMHAYTIMHFDVDGDGFKDIAGNIISGGPFDAYWCQNIGPGAYSPPQAINGVSLNPMFADHFDYDLDGLDDFAFVTGWDMYVQQNLGQGNFGPEQLINDLLPKSNSIIAADLNNDGDEELIVTAHQRHDVCYFENLSSDQSSISGKVFFDENQNGVFDGNDVGLSNIQIASVPSTVNELTNTNGDYNYSIVGSLGTYQIVPINIPVGWNLTSDSTTYQVEINSGPSTYTNLDFGYYPDSTYFEIETQLSANWPSCNLENEYWIHYQNNGTAITDGIIKIVLDNQLTYGSSVNAPDSIVGQNIFWSFDSLGFSNQGQELFYALVPGGNIGDTLASYVEIMIFDTLGVYQYSEFDTIIQILTCSSNSNYKSNDPIGADSLGYIGINTSSLEYTIHFQNTGTDTVQNLKIIDELDPNLNWQSVVILGSSHQHSFSLNQYGGMEFLFNNIDLVDSTTNEPLSHGYISFQIDLIPGLPHGTVITNEAEVIFDDLVSINTNVVVNTLFDCMIPLDSAVFPITTCPDEIVFGTTFDPQTSTEYIWTIDGIDTALGVNYQWLADTMGIFDIELKFQNGLCSDSISNQIEVFYEYPPVQLPSVNICDGDSAMIFGSYYSSSGLVYDTIPTINGCDSVLFKELVVDSVHVTNFGQSSICDGDSSLIFGNYQFTQGTYYDTLQASTGCDSLLAHYLNVDPSPNTVISTNSPDTVCLNWNGILFSGSPGNGTYSGPGMIGNMMVPGDAGLGTHVIYYTVTNGFGCTDSDSIIRHVTECLSIPENAFPNLTIYPNPFSDFTTISFGQELSGDHNIKIFDALGREVYAEENVTGAQIQIYKDQMGAGIYLFSIFENSTGDEVFNAKLIVE